MTDVRVATMAGLSKPFQAAGLPRETLAQANAFVTELAAAADRGDTPPAERLQSGAALLETLEKQIDRAEDESAIAIGISSTPFNQMDQKIEELDRGFAQARGTADRLRASLLNHITPGG